MEHGGPSSLCGAGAAPIIEARHCGPPQNNNPCSKSRRSVMTAINVRALRMRVQYGFWLGMMACCAAGAADR
jgi:hypothetical protein